MHCLIEFHQLDLFGLQGRVSTSVGPSGGCGCREGDVAISGKEILDIISINERFIVFIWKWQGQVSPNVKWWSPAQWGPRDMV